MIAFLHGKLIWQDKNFVILDVGGVGYKVFLSEGAISKMPQIRQEVNPVREATSSNGVKLYTFLYVREDALELYGFLTFEELKVFETVLSIPGVGPKAALGISGLGSMDQLKEALSKGQTAFFEKVPGVGRKKAQKIALELTGKLDILSTKAGSEKISVDQEALKILINLGFSKKSCLETLMMIEKENPGLSSKDKIKMALKYLSKS